QLDVGVGEPPQRSDRRAIRRIRLHARMLVARTCRGARVDGPEAQAIVEPERTGAKPFEVGAAELRRLYDETGDTKALQVHAQNLSEQQRRLAAPKGFEDVDADAAGARKRPAAAVADREPVLEQHHPDV